MTYKALIPNMLTSSNLVFGVCSIFSTMQGDFFWGPLFILFALAADGLDGRAARFFGVGSEIGKELDSLCDLVSFGVAPCVLAYEFCLSAFSMFGLAAAICFALCGAWRLARFNVNAGIVHGYFMGLAIPAGGCFVATSTLLLRALGVDPHSFGWMYPAAVLAVAFLMVSEVHYPDFKGKGEKIYLVSKIFFVLIFAAVLFMGRGAPHFAVLFAVFATYAVFGVINTVASKMIGKS